MDLVQEEISRNLATKRIGRRVKVLETAASTNDIAASFAARGDYDGLAVFTEEQTAGRGRGGTRWKSGNRDSILCSILLVKEEMNPELLSLAAAVAVAECIGRQGRHTAKIRWPNDITLGGRKVAGILLDARSAGDASPPDYVIGIGINCLQQEGFFAGELAGEATSIAIENASGCDRSLLARRLLAAMEMWLGAARSSETEVTERWHELGTLLGKRLSLMFNRKKYKGRCIGLDPRKGLIVQLESGGVRMFDAAHTRIVRQLICQSD
jgi:BirA family biotin operon repressor/biotin-[acetyl-CoA-carboxylase] ligase